MNRYESYKEVDLPWLKEVPSHWEVDRAKNHFTYEKLLNKNNIEKNILSLTLKGVIKNNVDKPIGLSPSDYSTYQLFKTGDLVFKLIDLNNVKTSRVGLVFEDGAMSSAYIRLFKKNGNYFEKYFYYWYFKLYLEEVFNKLGSGVRETIGKDDLLALEVPIPPLQEQTQIANYLDWKINEIDKLIAKAKEKIKELNDLKKITVSDIFMLKKENTNKIVSKYEWIGEIPDYYKVYPLKKLCNKIIDGTHQTPQYTSEGVPFLRVTDISKLEYGESINWDNVAFISKEEHKELYKRCNPEKNDVLVSKNGTIGIPKIVDWKEEVSIFVSLCLLKLNNIVIPEWIFYYFLTYLTEREISYGGKTGTITNLHLNKIREFKIPVPNLSKQKEIVKKINMAINKINNLINKTNQQIQNLESLKQSLISEVVTGGIDVRDVVIPDYKKFNLENDAGLEEEVEEDA